MRVFVFVGVVWAVFALSFAPHFAQASDGLRPSIDATRPDAAAEARKSPAGAQEAIAQWLKEVRQIMKSEPPLGKRVRADKVLLVKGERRLTLLRRGRVLKNYRVSLGFDPDGHKQQEGDGRTPEGRYVLDWRNPKSKYHLSLHVSYPNKQDKVRAKKAGVSPGGAIMIHGLPNGFGHIGKFHRFHDWTHGCIAVTDVEIREIWRAVRDGTPIEIRP